MHAPLTPLSALEVGTNKNYINTGLLRHEIETSIAPQLLSTLATLDQSPTDSFNLAVSGFLLPLLQDYAPEALAQLQSFVKEKNVSLLAVPYYGSSPAALSGDELSYQLALQQDALKEVFQSAPSGFFSVDGSIPSTSYEKIVIGSAITSQVALSSLAKPITTTPIIALGQDVTHQAEQSELEDHLLTEYMALTPHVHATEDEALLAQWRLLGQTSMFAKANPQVNLHDAYDHYAMYMNVLNDVAHKIKSIELSKQGLFLSQPELVASPASLLTEFNKKG
jgi:hypothetical protein